jgi:hypothetical protein
VKKGLVGSIITLIGGYLIGYAQGINAAVDAILNTAANLVLGTLSSIGSAHAMDLGQQVFNSLNDHAKGQFGDQLLIFYILGIIIAILGIYLGYEADQTKQEA